MLDTVTECEREVEFARAKLNKDLEILRSPSTVSAFTDQIKREAISTKDAVVAHTKQSVETSLAGLIEDVKAKAAANPLAAIAIGAGIAWQLFRRPPIATILVGAGAFNLWRTPVARVGNRTNQDYVNEGKQRLKDQANRLRMDASAAADDAGRVVAEKADQAYCAAKEHVQDWSRDAAGAVAEIVSRAKADTEHVMGAAREALASSVDRGATIAARASVGAKTLASDTVSVVDGSVRGQSFSTPNARDTVLLGAAGLAVAGALGIAYQKLLRE